MVLDELSLTIVVTYITDIKVLAISSQYLPICIFSNDPSIINDLARGVNIVNNSFISRIINSES
jgi:hypothetical protein